MRAKWVLGLLSSGSKDHGTHNFDSHFFLNIENTKKKKTKFRK